eukprot:TRINITY_DN2428_c0_g2_i8.p2 TRINITY_DN2428_c0_g2~~TRINITY_DN2428_c0_g2_i8.p2  ORF type:complete len:107 (-),score=12.50 TRINITY_DN2428_c0_g2_i8:74-394(-)
MCAWVIFTISVLLLAQNHRCNVSAVGTLPSSVNIGALFAFDSTIGRVARTAIELAVEDVNGSQDILNGTEIKLFSVDSNCNAFLGTEAADKLWKLWQIQVVPVLKR